MARLDTLRAGYLSERYRLEDRRSRYPQTLAALERRIEALTADRQTAAQNPARNGEEFSLEVAGVLCRSKEAAGAALMARAKACTDGEWQTVGQYRGFPLALRLTTGWLGGEVISAQQMSLHGTAEVYLAEVGSDPAGNIARLNNLLDKLPEVLERVQGQRETLTAQLAPLEEALQKPWPQEAEWQEKTVRLQALNAELNTEGREPGTADPTPDPEESPQRTHKPRERER